MLFEANSLLALSNYEVNTLERIENMYYDNHRSGTDKIIYRWGVSNMNFFWRITHMYEEYEIESSKDEEEGYDTKRFKQFNQNLSGLTKGLYIFAGESNGGKTAVMSNLLKI